MRCIVSASKTMERGGICRREVGGRGQRSQQEGKGLSSPSMEAGERAGTQRTVRLGAFSSVLLPGIPICVTWIDKILYLGFLIFVVLRQGLIM